MVFKSRKKARRLSQQEEAKGDKFREGTSEGGWIELF